MKLFALSLHGSGTENLYIHVYTYTCIYNGSISLLCSLDRAVVSHRIGLSLCDLSCEYDANLISEPEVSSYTGVCHCGEKTINKQTH